MKILGIDFGEKRIGLAISDESQTLAREFGILSPQEFWRQIGTLIVEHQVKIAVVGWPLNMSGVPTNKTQQTEDFKKELEKRTGLKVMLMDERLSTVMAKSLPGGKKNVDSFAAQIILQNYLNVNRLEKDNKSNSGNFATIGPNPNL